MLINCWRFRVPGLHLTQLPGFNAACVNRPVVSLKALPAAIVVHLNVSQHSDAQPIALRLMASHLSPVLR